MMNISIYNFDARDTTALTYLCDSCTCNKK